MFLCQEADPVESRHRVRNTKNTVPYLPTTGSCGCGTPVSHSLTLFFGCLLTSWGSELWQAASCASDNLGLPRLISSARVAIWIQRTGRGREEMGSWQSRQGFILYWLLAAKTSFVWRVEGRPSTRFLLLVWQWHWWPKITAVRLPGEVFEAPR